MATDGFRSLAEWGSIRALEFELRAKGPRLRTLIKAAGLWYPNVNANTSSYFRVDHVHHKLSVASMLGPSPDWVVGVSGLNLCEKDCNGRTLLILICTHGMLALIMELLIWYFEKKNSSDDYSMFIYIGFSC